MTTQAVTPAPPAHLPEEIQTQWTDAYNKALAQAKKDNPNSERAQRTAAIKVANQLQSVTPPTSAAEIDALEPWQTIRRETVTRKDGSRHRVCVTIDGRKYAFPVAKQAVNDEKPPKSEKPPKAPAGGASTAGN